MAELDALDEHNDKPLLRERAGGTEEGGDGNIETVFQSDFMPKKQWLYVFPEAGEEFFREFDDTIIRAVQRTNNFVVHALNIIVLVGTTVEVGVGAVWSLFIVGYDDVATAVAWLMIASVLVSQCMKRFVWRDRPHMRRRATGVRQDKTSSFPSRAVTLAVVYTYAVVLAYHVTARPPTSLQWWAYLIIPLAALWASYARVSVGAHYPSDCLVGTLQGTVCCLLGSGLRAIANNICLPCAYAQCYGVLHENAVEWKSLGHLNYIMLVIGSVVAVGVYIALASPPLRFWEKSHFVLGPLLGAMAFQWTCLCPTLAVGGYALAPPLNINYYYLFVTIPLHLVFVIVGNKAKSSTLTVGALMFTAFYALTFLSLVIVRLSTE